MSKTRKVQVTLSEEHYERLRQVAEDEDKSLALVVRESIVRYCLEPAERTRRQRAVERLAGIEAEAPVEYPAWERQYSWLKSAERDGPGSPADGDAER